MWPFSSSNAAIVTQKRGERSGALESAPKELAEHIVFLRATGKPPEMWLFSIADRALDTLQPRKLSHVLRKEIGQHHKF